MNQNANPGGQKTQGTTQAVPEKKFGLIDRIADIEPVAVVYNVTGSAIEEFVYNYLAKVSGIDGVTTVKTNIVNDGVEKPRINLYAFIRTDSADISSNMKQIPTHLRRKMEEGSYKPSDKLRRSLSALTKDPKVGVQDGTLYAKLNIFKALGMMLSVDPSIHDIRITEVRRMRKRNCILSVIKSNKFIDNDDAGVMDKYDRIIGYIED